MGSVETSLFIALLGISVAGNGLLWWRIGRLETLVKKMCPFGSCPLFKRASEEAAPERKEDG